MLAATSELDVTGTVRLDDPSAVADAVCTTLHRGFGALMGGEDFLRKAFQDIKDAFWGRYPGLLQCDTPYHDLRHSLDTALLVARMADGCRHLGEVAMSADDAVLAVFLGLYHDIGFIRRTGEEHLNGAQLMREHEARSVEFARQYLRDSCYAARADWANLIHVTNFAVALVDLAGRRSPEEIHVARLIGSSDLISQVSDRLYLERCRDFLYREFSIAGFNRSRTPNGAIVVLYKDPHDLLEKTPGFYENLVRRRLESDFGGIDRALFAHFSGSNPYLESIEKNLGYLSRLIAHGELAEGLRRHPVPLMPQR